MPSWLLPSLLTGGLTLVASALRVIWAEIKASKARQNKQIDELRGDLKDGLSKLEARQREDNKALNEKLDRLLESRLPTPR